MRLQLNIIGNLLAGVLVVAALTGCIRDEQSPGYEYMPDMYRSPAVEAYVDYAEVRDTIRPEMHTVMSARKPVAGTVPMTDNAIDDMPYTLPNTNEGYEKAGEVLKTPFTETEEFIAEGQEIYINFCLHCHGEAGAGDGLVITNGGHPAPQAYDGPLKDLPEGKMFHTLTYGKGAMGSHASQLTKTERWKVIAYVKTLQGNDEPVAAEVEETEMAETAE